MNSYPSLKDLLGLCKLKVVLLILFTALVVRVSIGPPHFGRCPSGLCILPSLHIFVRVLHAFIVSAISILSCGYPSGLSMFCVCPLSLSVFGLSFVF